jgi:hypothetical protein
MKSKYYVRVMRPTFHRTVLTVEAQSEEAAVLSALMKADLLPETEWAQLEAERQLAVVETVLSEEEAEGDSEADDLEYVRGVEYAYALLQADLDSGEGTFIAPLWLKEVPALAAADITQDWSEALSGICGEETEAFYAWLTRQRRPSNVVDFLARRDRCRGTRTKDPDSED